MAVPMVSLTDSAENALVVCSEDHERDLDRSLTQMQIEAVVQSRETAVHDDVFGCHECSLLLVALPYWVVHARRVALGHQNRDLRSLLRDLERACDCHKQLST